MKDTVYNYLKEHNIPFEVTEHKPVFTIEDMEEAGICALGDVCKNLFLRDQKGKRHFLVCALENTAVDLKKLGDKLGTKLSFASDERLLKYLGLIPGSVSPFGLLNDKDHAVELVLDKGIQGKSKLGFHPNENTATVWINYKDFKKYIDSLDYDIVTI